MSRYQRKKEEGLIEAVANFVSKLRNQTKECQNILEEEKVRIISEHEHAYAPKKSQPETKKPTLKLNKSLLRSIDWKNYENVCTAYLLAKNINAKTTGLGADGGIDIKVYNQSGEQTGVAQCKAWKKKIGVNLVRELFGVMASEGIDKGIFFTTSTFTFDAIQFCRNKNILLIDGDELIKRIKKLDESQKAKILDVATKGNYETPSCARCGVKMTLRISKKGRSTGNKFWGCVNFPRCRSIINI